MARHLLLLLLLCACAAPIVQRDERRSPRGWTIDSSNQDMRAANIREKKAFGEGKIIEADNFRGDSLTSEATLVSGDSREQLQQLIKDFNKLLCVNNALEQAILEAEDKRCFARVRTPKQLEVHVSTAIGAMRDDSKWPKFSVTLGGEDGVDFRGAYAPDGGTVVFTKRLTTNDEGKRVYNMKQLVNHIGLHLRTEPNKKTGFFNDYEKFEEAYGDDFCLERRSFFIVGGACRDGKRTNLKESMMIEYNKLIITRVEIYLRFEGDKNSYKIFSSRSSRDEPLTILDNSNATYTITGFDNNPHWLLHYHSSKCNAWDNRTHDGTEFGEYIWNNYINNNSKDSVNIFTSPLHCPGSSAVPVSVVPEIPEDLVDRKIDDWLDKNKNKDKFKSHPNSSAAECQPRTAQMIKEEAVQDKKCGKDAPQPLLQPADLNKWSEERLVNGIKYMRDVNNLYDISNESFITRLNWETGSGCFYEKQLQAGMHVKIDGQELVRVSGKLMTKREAETCIFKDGHDNVAPPEGNNLYINLGLNALSYPMLHTVGKGKDSIFKITKFIKEPYTENFAIHDLSYVYFTKKPNNDFFSNKVISQLEQDMLLAPERIVDAVTVPVEVGIIAIHKIEIMVSGNTIYKAGVNLPPNSEDKINDNELCKEENSGKSVIENPLFILSNRANAWQDYNLRGNEKWEEYRNKNDHCGVEAE